MVERDDADYTLKPNLGGKYVVHVALKTFWVSSWPPIYIDELSFYYAAVEKKLKTGPFLTISERKDLQWSSETDY